MHPRRVRHQRQVDVLLERQLLPIRAKRGGDVLNAYQNEYSATRAARRRTVRAPGS